MAGMRKSVLSAAICLRLYLIALGLTVRNKESKVVSCYSLLLRAALCLPNLLITLPLPKGFWAEDFLQNLAMGTLPSSPCSSALDIKMQIFQDLFP